MGVIQVLYDLAILGGLFWMALGVWGIYDELRKMNKP